MDRSLRYLYLFAILFFLTQTVKCRIPVPVETNIKLSNIDKLDEDGKIILAWEVDMIKEEITFEIEAETMGYVGFGISPQGSMTGADIFIAGVMPDGTPYFSDRHGTGFTVPTIDNHSDWTLLEAAEFSIAGKTFLKFFRKLETCDDEDYTITKDTNRLIWAMGDTDSIVYHTPERRGSRSVNLLGAPIPDVNLDEMQKWAMTLEMDMPSDVDTAYWCSFHKGPILDKKHHIVAFDALPESPEALRHTHHFILYNCYLPQDSNQTLDEVFENSTFNNGNMGNYCYLEQQTLPTQYCREYLYVWAKGGKRMVFPENVGYPIAEGDDTGKQSYYMLEIHYDNPEVLKNVTFRSGVQFYFNNNTRPVEAGLLMVSHEAVVMLTVPPNISEYVVSGHCSTDCSAAFPENGITVFNSLLHSHLSGRKLKLRHFRGSQELPWLDFDDHYDFEYQQNKPLFPEIKVLPGDQLTYECTYDSRWKNGEVVVGGLTTRDEMCEAFLWHYPRQKYDICSSDYPFESHLDQFCDDGVVGGDSVLVIDEPLYLQGTYQDSLSYKFNWTVEFLEQYQSTHRFGLHDSFCMNRKSGEFNLYKVKYPENMVVNMYPKMLVK